MGGDSSNSNAGGKLLGRCVGSAIAGFSELALFHPVDTIAKRLMTKEGTVAFSQMNAVIFRDAADAGWAVKARSLFPGLGYAAGYKILQRVYKFGGQPFVLDLMRSNCSSPFEAVFGKRNSKAWMHATAGSLIGVGEVALLPLDVLKIRAQTNPQVSFLKNSSFNELIGTLIPALAQPQPLILFHQTSPQVISLAVGTVSVCSAKVP
ncbi:hypothetical protein T492DRAFT_413537 [Pavlovales sp. CCMP2436]|nr:hypothetical protein T492DRAFT_413537 [Pavlovales sp. CCMP2436]